MEDYIESVETPEVAEPVDTEVSDVTNDAVETNTEVANEAAAPAQEQVQSAEENARYAAARRRAEQEFAERQKAEDAEYARRFAGYENPVTHQPILSKKDYFDALDAQEKIRMEQNLQSGNVSADDLNSYIEKQISNNPAILQAQQIIEQTRQAEAKRAIDNDVKKIQQIDSTVKSIEDIMNSDRIDQIMSYVNTNKMNLVDAYKMANFDRLIAHSNAGAKQAALNNMKGTQHLNQTNGVANTGEGGVDIPENELSKWRRAFPDASLKELKAKYNRTL